MTPQEVNVLREGTTPNDPNPAGDEAHECDVKNSLKWYRIDYRQPGQWSDRDEHDHKEETENDQIHYSPGVARLFNVGFRIR